MKPTAQIIHQTRDRTRLRVAGKKRDVQFFSDIEVQLTRLPGIEAVKTNPLSGSVLLLHPDSAPEDTLSDVEKLGLFNSIDTGGESKATGFNPGTITSGLVELEDNLTAIIEKENAPFFFMLIALAAVQAMRGNILGPASHLLGTALEVAKKSQAKQSGTSL